MSYSPSVSSALLSQNLWFNYNIKINHKVIAWKDFAAKNINYVSQLFHADGSLKSWNDIKNDFALDEKLCFKWMQLIHAIPRLVERKYS